VTTAAGDPNVPALARTNTVAGAEAFTAYFLTAANTSYRDLKPELLRPLVAGSCKTCAGFIEQIESYKAKSQHYEGNFVTPTLITISTFESSRAVVFVSTDTKAAKVVSADGHVVEELPAETGNTTTYLTFDNASWTVTEIKVMA